jgi:hypothetical protein
LCFGHGDLKCTEILDRLGVKDFARVAQLSAEEAFRLLLSKHKNDDQNVWARFETELTKRTAEIGQRHRDEIHTLTSRTKELETAARTVEQQKAHEIEHMNRRVEDSLRQVADLQQRNQELESQMSKVARRGKLEEISFEDEVQAWPGMCVSEKLPKNGDYLVAYRDPSGAVLEPRLLIDNKDKATIAEGDIKKLIRDAKERHIPIGVIAAKDETQLRQADRDCRWAIELTVRGYDCTEESANPPARKWHFPNGCSWSRPRATCIFSPPHLKFAWGMIMWAVFLLLSPLIFLGVLVFGIHFMSADEIGLMKILLVDEGGYRQDPSFPFAPDYDLFSRIGARHLLANLAEPLVLWRIHSGNTSFRNAEQQIQSEVFISFRNVCTLITDQNRTIDARYHDFLGLRAFFLTHAGKFPDLPPEQIIAGLKFLTEIEEAFQRRYGFSRFALTKHQKALNWTSGKHAVALGIRAPWVLRYRIHILALGFRRLHAGAWAALKILLSEASPASRVCKRLDT